MNPLPKRPLGTTGFEVSVLALGTVKWGRNQNVKYPAFTLPDDAALQALLDRAEEAGINLIDTAPAYGIAEERVGAILSQRKTASFLIATKTGEEFVDGQSQYDYSVTHTEASVHRSLRRLGREALDLVMVHCNSDDVTVLTATPIIATLQRLREQGLVRAIGVSTMTVAGGLLAAECADVLMVPFSVTYRDHLPVIERAGQLKKGILIKRGLYSGPAATGRQLPLSDHLAAVLQCPGVTSLVAGTINSTHLEENIMAAHAACKA